jgi:DNA (cytosine-5)-methyltransferase 1
VREIMPKAFIFENVKGLRRATFRNYYDYILQQLRYPDITIRRTESWQDHARRIAGCRPSGASLSYQVVAWPLNAVDYGVPQRRERVFVVGVRSDIDAQPSAPCGTHSREALLRDQWITGDYWERHRIPKRKKASVPDKLRPHLTKLRHMTLMTMKPWRTVRDAIADLPKIRPGQTSEKVLNHFLNPGARSYPGHTGSPYDEPAKALKAGVHGVPGGENTLRLANGRVRYFSVRECARLQTFPDEWAFEGAWSEGMRQLGNAVPVDLAHAVGLSLREALQEAGAWEGQETHQPGAVVGGA